MKREARLGDLYTLEQMPPLYDRYICPGVVVSFHLSFFYGAYGISPSYSSSARVAVLEDLFAEDQLWEYSVTGRIKGYIE